MNWKIGLEGIIILGGFGLFLFFKQFFSLKRIRKEFKLE